MMPVRKSKTNAPPAPLGERDADGDYVFPERIVLDDASFEAFSAEVSNPSEPNAASRALFKAPDDGGDEHEVGLSVESSKLLIAGTGDVRSGRVRRMDPNEFDDE